MLDLLLPQRCSICFLPGAALCAACFRALVRLVPPVCERCGAPGAWPVRTCVECSGRRLGFATARSALVYERHTTMLVSRWKEHGRRGLTRLLASLVAEVVPRPDADVVAYVPGAHDRVLRRGHSPPERLARELGRLWELPVRPLLVRSRYVPRQRGLPLAARRRNVAGAFAAVGRPTGRIALVDDVYTTGSTMSACAAALRRAGAVRVDAVSLARAVR